MKKLAFSLCAVVVLAASAFAGETYTRDSKTVVPPALPAMVCGSRI
jgi:hypothetical protein